MVAGDITAFIACSYSLLTLTFGPNIEGVSTKLVCISFLSFGAFSLDMLIYLNYMSQTVVNGVTKLKEAILALNVPKDCKITLYEDKETNAEQGRQRILALLDGFQGFDCRGYFVLGKPLLTSIFSHFITFFFVLIQFRLSESSPNVV